MENVPRGSEGRITVPTFSRIGTLPVKTGRTVREPAVMASPNVPWPTNVSNFPVDPTHIVGKVGAGEDNVTVG
jgi:hypothetical protein